MANRYRKDCDMCGTTENLVLQNNVYAYCEKCNAKRKGLKKKKVGHGKEEIAIKTGHKVSSKFLDPMQEDLK